jgi:enoyl-CoA hydratase/carnithine racemase
MDYLILKERMTIMPDVFVDIEKRDDQGKVVRITLDNAKKLNTLNSPLIEQLSTAIERYQDDEDLRVMILTGSGSRAFIGGADINELAGLSPATAVAFITRLHNLCSAIRDLPVPVIARISGYCLGGGLEVAASCDLRVATADSTFGMPEVNVGIPSVIEAALLPTLIGFGKTRELVYTGQSVSAEDALKFGLVERVVPEDGLDRAVADWVEAIANAGPKAIRLQKALIRHWESLPLDHAVEQGIHFLGKAYESDEPKARMRRFLEQKRK